VKLRVTDCVADCAWLGVPQRTEWQRLGNQIKAALIGSRSHFVNVKGTLQVHSSDPAWRRRPTAHPAAEAGRLILATQLESLCIPVNAPHSLTNASGHAASNRREQPSHLARL